LNENINNELEEEEKDFEKNKKKFEIEKENKEREIDSKKKKAFFLNQSKDLMENNSEWGSFRIRSAESLEILEDESFYRTPLTNLIENETEYYFLVELPGLNKKHVNITLQEGILEILGEKAFKHKEKKEDKKKKEKKEDKDKKDEKKDKHKEKKDKKKEKYKDAKGDFLRREFRSPSFYRSFQLPEEISSEGIDASFKNGVLRLRIPKKLTEIADKKTIEIK
jgi:HSP20 family protein